ncbi:MAG: hypothetical protein R6V35_00540 [Candidatus Nanohaloarchaea archaeon]
MRKTVNISKAKTASRQSRAKKAVSVLKSHFEEDVKVSPELNEQIWSKGIENPPSKVTVSLEDGTLYPAESFESETQEVEEETEEPDQTEEAEDESSESVDEDYSEVVDGTMDEVKDRVGELEDPDFEALIEAEEADRDRKTMKEWLENQ